MQLILQREQIVAREVGLLVDIAHIDISGAESVRLVDLLTVLAQQQQRALTFVEAVVLERLLNELRFTGLEEAGEEVDRNVRRLLFFISQCGTAPSAHPPPDANRSRTRGR